jgi:hypothetical protein
MNDNPVRKPVRLATSAHGAAEIVPVARVGATHHAQQIQTRICLQLAPWCFRAPVREARRLREPRRLRRRY